jgi:hypothetical protein
VRIFRKSWSEEGCFPEFCRRLLGARTPNQKVNSYLTILEMVLIFSIDKAFCAPFSCISNAELSIGKKDQATH